MYKRFCLNRGRILGRNPDKSLKSFPPCYSRHLYSIALRFLFLHTHATSGKEKWGKPDRNPYQLPYGLRNPYRNLKPENSQDYTQKPQWNCTFMNSACITVMQLLVLLKRGSQCHDMTAFTNEFSMAHCPWLLRFFQNSTSKSHWDIRVFRPQKSAWTVKDWIYE